MSDASKLSALFAGGSVVHPSLGGAPTGCVFAFAGSSAPMGWLLCYGQAVSRTTYASLFSVIGTTYGVGDGSTTFNLPDLRGRSVAGKDDMGGSAASVLNVTLTGTRASTSTGVITGLSSTVGLSIGMQAFGTGIGTNAVISSIDSSTQVTLSVNSSSTGSNSIRFGVVDGATLGAVGGSHVHKLVTAQMAAHTHPMVVSNNDRNTTSGGSDRIVGISISTLNTNSTGGDQAHPNMQPTIILNSIIKT